MGANLNRLMQSYGVYTPTVSAYSGVATPDALKAGATAGEKGTYQGALADYAAQQAAFRGYETDYKNRIANTNLYTSPDTASTFLSTPNYSGIRGMRANLSDTTSADTTDYTNPNFSSMINDAYRSLGRVGIGTDTSNIDQPGYNYWMSQLQAGANGGIAPRDFKNRFKIATNDYIRQKPDDDYTKYIQGYLGILPATTMPVLPTPGGGTTSGTGGDTGMGGEGPASPGGSDYEGGAKDKPGDLMATLSSIGDWFGGLLGGSTGAPQSAAGAYGQLAGAATDQETAAQAAAAEIAAQGAAEDAANSSYMARGGSVSSPTAMEEALLRDRSRHEFSDPRFEEIYGKYFYDTGGSVRGYSSVSPSIYTGAPRVLLSDAEHGSSLGSSDDAFLSAGSPDDLMSLVYPRIPGRGATVEVEPPPGTFISGRGATLEPEPFLSTVSAPTLAPPPSVTRPNTSFSGDSSQTVDAIKRAREALDAYRKGLTEQSSSETDPDAAEKWFRLAAAFLAPTKTGKLGEAVGIAATSEVERQKANTLRKTAEKNKRDEMGLKGLALDYKLTHDEVLALREDEKERNRARLAIYLREMELLKPSDRERMIREIMQSENVPYNVAAAFVNKTVVMGTNPVTHQPIQINAITGQQVPETGAGAANQRGAETSSTDAAKPAVPTNTLWQLASKDVTGLLAGAKATAQPGTSQIAWDVARKGLLEDRQTFDLVSNELVRALALNPRFPVSEMDNIRREINISPNIYTSASALKERMRSVDNYLRNRLEDEKRTGQNKNLPPSVQKDALSAANSIESFLTKLGVPKDAPPPPRVGDKQTDANGKMRVFIGGDPASAGSWPLVAEGGGQ